MQRSVRCALRHQEYPFAALVEDLRPGQDGSAPIQVMFVFQKPHLAGADHLAAVALGHAGVRWRLGNLEVESMRLDPRHSPFELVLTMAEFHGELLASFQYRTERFDAAAIARLAGHVLTILEGAVTDPHKPVSRMPLLTSAERDGLLRAATPVVETARERTLHQLFEEQAKRRPDATAVTFQGDELSYAELDRRANRLAHHLRSLGVGPEVRVGIRVEPSPRLVVGILGILKSGGAYVPVDPRAPAERARWICEDADVALLVTEKMDQLPLGSIPSVCLDTDGDTIASRPEYAPSSGAASRKPGLHHLHLGFDRAPKGQPHPPPERRASVRGHAPLVRLRRTRRVDPLSLERLRLLRLGALRSPAPRWATRGCSLRDDALPRGLLRALGSASA